MEQKLCLICTAPIKFTRLGVDACRACAQFFKRTRVGAKQYTCRQGDGKCQFRKHEKFMCRACRYDRCVALGMELVVKEEKDEEEEETPEDPDAPGSSTTSSSPSSSSTSGGVTSPTLSPPRKLLDAVKEAYYDAYDRRLTSERNVALRYRLKRIQHAKEVLFLSTMNSFNELFPTLIKEVIKMFERVLPFIRELRLDEKEALFQSAIGKFAMLEGVYRTNTVFEADNYLLITLITCMDMDNTEHWIRDEDWVDRKDDFRAVVAHYTDRYEALLVPFPRFDHFSETEFFALVVLAFCDIDLGVEFSDSIVASLESTRKAVYAELQHFYKVDEKLVDYSARMGRVLTISHTTNEAGILFNEEMRTYATLFDFQSGDSILRHAIYRR